MKLNNLIRVTLAAAILVGSLGVAKAQYNPNPYHQTNIYHPPQQPVYMPTPYPVYMPVPQAPVYGFGRSRYYDANECALLPVVGLVGLGILGAAAIFD